MSQVFSGIVGHDSILEVLGRMKAADRLPHALIFVGSRHVGRTAVAEALIRSLFETDRHLSAIPDVHVVERLVDEKTEKKKSAISVEQIRVLKEKLSMSPMIGPWKVGFIPEADKLSLSASNALLKTLEEPKGKTLLLLRTTSLALLPETIVSRCQVLRFYPVARTTIADALVKRGLDKVEASELAGRAFGRPGLSLGYISNTEMRAQSDTRVASALRLFEEALPQQFGLVTDLIPKQEQNKSELLQGVLNDLESVLRDVLLEQVDCSDQRVYKKEATQIASLAQRFTPDQTVRTLHAIRDVRRAMKHHINAHLALEHILLARHS